MILLFWLIIATENIAQPVGPMPAVFELYVRERWEV